MCNISNNIHDDRFSQADRIEIYKKVMTNPISTLASPEQYARVPLEGMPDPIGEVYRGDDIKKSIENIFKLSIINENDIKMEILEPVEHNRDFADHELKFCQRNNFINRDNMHMHCFPTRVFITEIDKVHENMNLISKQNVYVLGDLEDRVLIAENENVIKITNRDLSKHNYFGFCIEYNKNNQELYVNITISESKLGFMSYRSGEKKYYDASYEDICLKLNECFKKIYSVPYIGNYTNLEELEKKVYYLISIEQHGELANIIVDIIKQNGGLHLNLDQVLTQYCRSDFKDNILMSDADDIENRNKEMDEKAQTLVKRKYL